MRVVKAKSRKRRRDRRTQEIPLKIDLNGSSYETADWSLAGFCVNFFGNAKLGNHRFQHYL